MDSLKDLHNRCRTPQFVPDVKERYLMHPQTYAAAFIEFREARSTSLNALELINKARSISKNQYLGEDLFKIAQKNSEISRGLILEIKDLPEFQKQFSTYQKLQNQKKIAEELEDIKAAQRRQLTTNVAVLGAVMSK